jgi:hypothetical protein
MVRYLPPQHQALVDKARRCGLLEGDAAPAYLSPNLCTALSLVLAVPTLGYSLLLVPIVWVAQSERTTRRLERLGQAVARIESCSGQVPVARKDSPLPCCEREMTVQLT